MSMIRASISVSSCEDMLSTGKIMDLKCGDMLSTGKNMNFKFFHTSTIYFDVDVNTEETEEDTLSLNNMPLSTTKSSVLEAFDNGALIINGEDGIHILTDSAGTSTGLIYVNITNKEAVTNILSNLASRLRNHSVKINFERTPFIDIVNNAVPLVPTNCVIVTGIPDTVNVDQVKSFFEGMNIVPGGIKLRSAHHGMIKRVEARISFADEASINAALKLHQSFWQQRVVDIYKISEDKFNMESEDTSKQGEVTEYAIEMRGLPYSASFSDVIEFFRPVHVMHVDINTQRGTPTGLGLVYFASDEDLKEALTYHLKYMGIRYIELEKRRNVKQGEESFCATDFSVSMRGLPFSCNEDDVTLFFSPLETASVKIFKNDNGWLTGRGIAYFNSEEDAQTALHKHLQYMGTRYIEIKRMKRSDTNISSFGSRRRDIWKMPTPATIHPIASRVLSNNKSWMGRLLFGMRTPSDSENIRGYHTCGALLQYRTAALNKSFMRFGLLIRRIARM